MHWQYNSIVVDIITHIWRFVIKLNMYILSSAFCFYDIFVHFICKIECVSIQKLYVLAGLRTHGLFSTGRQPIDSFCAIGFSVMSILYLT